MERNAIVQSWKKIVKHVRTFIADFWKMPLLYTIKIVVTIMISLHVCRTNMNDNC